MNKSIIVTILLCCLVCSFNIQLVYADTSNNSAINSSAKEKDVILYEKIMSDIKDKETKNTLIKHIEERTAITGQYRGYMDKSTVLGVWCDKNIPLIGGVLYSVLTQATLHFYEETLADNPENETVTAFEELRSHYLDGSQDIFDAAIEGKFRNPDSGIVATIKSFESSNGCLERILYSLGYDNSLHNIDVLKGTIIDTSIVKKLM